MAENKFSRSNFLSKDLIEGIHEFDMTTNSINDFVFSREKTFYKIVKEDLKRPDIIAMKAYGDVESMQYWHILMRYNNIHDIWNDISIGDVLVVPNKIDIEELISFNKIQKQSE